MNIKHLQKQVRDLLEKFKIPRDLVDMETWTAICQNIANEQSPLNPLVSEYSIDEAMQFEKLCNLENLTVQKITITANGLPFTFKNDELIRLIFQDFISGLSKQSRNLRQSRQMVIHREAVIIDKALKDILTPRQRHIFIFELYAVAGFRFTPQQQAHEDQQKAALIRTWVERNKK